MPPAEFEDPLTENLPLSALKGEEFGRHIRLQGLERPKGGGRPNGTIASNTRGRKPVVNFCRNVLIRAQLQLVKKVRDFTRR